MARKTLGEAPLDEPCRDWRLGSVSCFRVGPMRGAVIGRLQNRRWVLQDATCSSVVRVHTFIRPVRTAQMYPAVLAPEVVRGAALCIRTITYRRTMEEVLSGGTFSSRTEPGCSPSVDGYDDLPVGLLSRFGRRPT